jgi:hypothetical protein
LIRTSFAYRDKKVVGVFVPFSLRRFISQEVPAGSRSSR